MTIALAGCEFAPNHPHLARRRGHRRTRRAVAPPAPPACRRRGQCSV